MNVIVFENITVNPLSLHVEWKNPDTGQIQFLYDEYLVESSEDRAVLRSAIRQLEEEKHESQEPDCN